MKKPTFVVNIADTTFLIHYKEKYEEHVLICKSDPSVNFKQQFPVKDHPSKQG